MGFARWPDALPRPGNQRFTQWESVAPWFEVYQINSDTFALLEPHHDEEVIAYLLLGSERAVLIDTGMGIGDIQAEVANLTDLPVIVVNTHAHFDHMGDNHHFADVWIFDHDWEVNRLKQGHATAEIAHYMGPNSYRNLPPGFDPSTYAIRPSPVTRRLRHLETIDLGGRSLTVHHTPGHSPGSICLLDNRDRLLFTGDTYYPGTLVAHLNGSDFSAYRASIEYLVGLLDQVNHLCPSHNEAYAPKQDLERVATAFEQIVAGQAPDESLAGSEVHNFQGFRVIVPQA